jgi:hypothetical protein
MTGVFLWLGTSKQTRRVKGGRKQRAFCPECGEETTFVEVEIHEKLQLFAVLDLLEDKERAFRCLECDLVGQLFENGEVPAGVLEDLSLAAAERLERARAAERLAQATRDRERRERECRAREARADEELAALKARMGLVPAGDGSADDGAPAKASRRPWWRLWRR